MPDQTRSIGYICPVCGQAVIASRTAFQLCAGDSALPCPCGKSELHFTQLGDRCEITVPCLLCARDHTAVCSNDGMLTQKLLALSCPKSGLGCCYIGEEGPVFRAMEQLEQAVDKLRADDEGERRGAFLNDGVMAEVLSELRDIAQRGGISCTCGSKKWGFDVNFSSVDLICQECGGKYRIPAATADDIDDLCCKTSILIRGKEK